MTNNLPSDLELALGLKFTDQSVLTKSLTHRSHLNENRAVTESNERLEFLGDAVLELWTSHQIFNLFPNLPEGELTGLRSLIVCTENLAKVAKSIDLGNYIYLSRGEEANGGRSNPSILADTLESVIGAVYLDLGSPSSNKLLEKLFAESITELSSKKIFKDPKSIFQEIAQSKKGITPHYQTLSETGPDHQKTFESGVYIGSELIATGKGNSKQKAEEAAAISATQIL